MIPDITNLSQERAEDDEELAEMQRLKEAEQEHVRWRCVSYDVTEAAVVSSICAMRHEAMASLVEESEWNAC